jgi:hypothetical protein
VNQIVCHRHHTQQPDCAVVVDTMMNTEPHHTVPIHLRHLLSHNQRHPVVPPPGKSVPAGELEARVPPVEGRPRVGNGGVGRVLVGLRPNKSVSFAKVESVLGRLKYFVKSQKIV